MKDHKSSRGRSDRSRRAAALTVLLALVVGVGGTLAVSGLGGGGNDPSPIGYPKLYEQNTSVPGDANSDGKVSKQEKADLETTEKSRSRILDEVAAPQGVNTLLVTPSGKGWWQLVTGISAQTSLWTTAPPTGKVRWYAYTEGMAKSVLDGPRRPYDAIHIAFDDYDAARAWTEEQARLGLGATSTTFIRGSVVTLTAGFVDPTSEGFDPDPDGELSDIDVRIGMWTIDITGQQKNIAAAAGSPSAYRAFVENLGLGGDGVSWSATSAYPNAIWRGEVSGFNAGALKASDALGMVNASVDICRENKDCRVESAIAEGVNHVWLLDANGGGGGEQSLRPDRDLSDADLMWVTGAGWRGAISGDLGFVRGPIQRTELWIEDDTMAIRPVLETIPVAPEVPQTAG